MEPNPIMTRHVTPQDFERDISARKFRNEIGKHPQAFNRLFAVLNNPDNEKKLVEASECGRSALEGIIDLVETEPEIEKILKARPKENHFRRAVGVAIKLKIEKLGWSTTGRKSTIRGARYFTKAEIYKVQSQGTAFKPEDKTGHATTQRQRSLDHSTVNPETPTNRTSLRNVMLVVNLVAGILVAIGGVILLSEDQTTIGGLMIAAAVCGMGYATWRWLGELTR